MKKSTKVVSPLRLGNAVFVRSVTHYYTGRVVGLSATEILLEDAAWIASTGRFGAALGSGTLDEVEPFPDGVISVGRGAVIDVASWAHTLPRTVK
jgi:hypothetical protein